MVTSEEEVEMKSRGKDLETGVDGTPMVAVPVRRLYSI